MIYSDDIGRPSIPQCDENDQVAKMLTFAGREVELFCQDIEREKQISEADHPHSPCTDPAG